MHSGLSGAAAILIYATQTPEILQLLLTNTVISGKLCGIFSRYGDDAVRNMLISFRMMQEISDFMSLQTSSKMHFSQIRSEFRNTKRGTYGVVNNVDKKWGRLVCQNTGAFSNLISAPFRVEI
ncbi:hypothetical protein Zmor_013774 [Zophobas morio]|uniref:Uncharacterized protein n=1 Tax=Zophobas morio TaxID=2755281 RepID=A0AA38IB41_9CUCU|nr:hypothetical protein Zmor_013774 [Zophobas morio]